MAARGSDTCRLCGGESAASFTHQLLGRYHVTYYRCARCDLIQTQEPTWLGEAYASAICSTDTGAIARNQLTSQLTHVLARVLGIWTDDACLDYGGGHGVLVRMMRDRGYDFRLLDKYAANLFARGFEAQPGSSFRLVTTFETLEHLVEVKPEIDRIFATRPDFVLIGTQLHRGDGPGWWYYTPHTGQHVAFYSQRTMAYIAESKGYRAGSSRAYTLMIRDGVKVADWRINMAQRLVQKSRGDRNYRFIRALDKIIPCWSPRTGRDSEIARARAA